jgi:hypothetical protein
MTRRRIRSLLVVVVLAAGLSISARSSAAAVIQPGAPIVAGNALCTLNWIYDGAGGPYAGTAAHCVENVGQRVALDEAGGAPGGFGSVAFISPRLDYALIRIDAAELGNVNPAMRGHPDIPQGVSTQATAAVGDIVQYSGYGVVVSITDVTREQRIGVLGYNDGEQHFSYGVVTPGDSGGPVADRTDGNKALGIVDTIGVAVGFGPLPQAGEGGVSLEGMLVDAAAHGFTVTVRTV